MGIWGISYAGGHVVIVGATDPRVKCIVSTVPVVEGWETMRRCHGERKFAKLLDLVMEDRVRRSDGQPSAMMPMSHPDPDNNLSSWPFPHVHEIFLRIKEAEAPRHEHRNTVESVELLLQYNTFPYAKRILNTPTLVVVAEQDNITQWDLEIEMANTIPAPQQGMRGAGEGEPHEPVLHPQAPGDGFVAPRALPQEAPDRRVQAGRLATSRSHRARAALARTADRTSLRRCARGARKRR